MSISSLPTPNFTFPTLYPPTHIPSLQAKESSLPVFVFGIISLMGPILTWSNRYFIGTQKSN